MIFKRKAVSSVVLFSALSLAAVSSGFAQEKQENRKVSSQTEQVYVISAKAGGVSYASGAVRVDRIATNTRQVLAKGDEINDGDIISVGNTGNAEILLNPGSFLRLAENTDIQFADTNLESLLLKMKNGSALIEASAVGGEGGADIQIVTPQSTISLEKSGIYRLNVTPNFTEVYVWKGTAVVGNEIVKAGRKAVLQKGAATVVAKFDKDESRDALDLWSKDRSKELAKLNNRIRNRDLTRAFSGFSSGFYGFNRFGGYWAFNRLTGNYCYVPYGFSNWNSPYGYSYGNGIYWYYQRDNYNPVVQVVSPKPKDLSPPTKHDVNVYSPPVIYTPPAGGASAPGKPKGN
ncbi:MAG: FecR domain-containing protein [Acidobacteriota bacterium]|nr:FecR domain-containing protein [Acidobacteriota bacterium]